MHASRFILLVISLLVISLGGCKTTREYGKTKSQVVETVENDIQSKADNSIAESTTDSVSENETAEEIRVIEETIVELSKPDTSGVQYPVKITTRTETAGKQKNRNAGKVSTSNTTTASTEITSDNSKSQVTNNTDKNTKVVTKQRRNWVPVLIVLALIGLLALRYRKPIATAFKRAFN